MRDDLDFAQGFALFLVLDLLFVIDFCFILQQSLDDLQATLNLLVHVVRYQVVVEEGFEDLVEAFI